MAKELVNQMKGQATEGKKIFASYKLEGQTIPGIHTELLKN